MVLLIKNSGKEVIDMKPKYSDLYVNLGVEYLLLGQRGIEKNLPLDKLARFWAFFNTADNEEQSLMFQIADCINKFIEREPLTLTDTPEVLASRNHIVILTNRRKIKRTISIFDLVNADIVNCDNSEIPFNILRETEAWKELYSMIIPQSQGLVVLPGDGVFIPLPELSFQGVSSVTYSSEDKKIKIAYTNSINIYLTLTPKETKAQLQIPKAFLTKGIFFEEQ